MNIKNNKKCNIIINDTARGNKIKETKIIIDNVGKQNIVFDEDKVLENLRIKINIKSADEMFEELGYKKITDYEEMEISYIRNYKYSSNIKFNIIKQSVIVYYGENKAGNIILEILQAINKKCQELGWI